jgi:hypothetical protein
MNPPSLSLSNPRSTSIYPAPRCSWAFFRLDGVGKRFQP